MKNFKQWLTDKLFNLLSHLSPTEQPTPGELRAWALEEAQKPPQPQIWYDPTVRSYPQKEPPQKRTDPLHFPPGTLARGWHAVEVTGVHPTISQALKRIRMEPVRTNTAPIDPPTDFPKWLTGEDDPTLEVPAIKKRAYQEYQKRHAG